MSNNLDSKLSKPIKKPKWMYNDWAIDHKIKRYFPNPYNGKEVIKWGLKSVFGVSKMYKKNTNFIDRTEILNIISKTKYKIGFVGDIMCMYKNSLSFDVEIKEFFKDVDLIVGNFEGTMTIQPSFVMSQRHHKSIMKTLASIKEPEKWLLCLSNNHSGVFGFADYCFSLNELKYERFNVFGRNDTPYFPFSDDLRIVSGTQWTNQKDCKYISRYSEEQPIPKGYQDDCFDSDPHVFNILYPHWHYEYELYPRPKVIEKTKPVIKKWDLIFGCHTHIPQPITKFVAPRRDDPTKNITKLLAYSGGNFNSGLYPDKYHHGIIAKCEIGPLIDNKDILGVGKVDWSFVHSEQEELPKQINKKMWNRKGKVNKWRRFCEKIVKEQMPSMEVSMNAKCPYFKDV